MLMLELVLATEEIAAGGSVCTTAGTGTSMGAWAWAVVCAMLMVLVLMEVLMRVLVVELEVLVTMITREELVVLVERLASAAAVSALLLLDVVVCAAAALAVVDLGIAEHRLPLMVVKKAPGGSGDGVDMSSPDSFYLGGENHNIPCPRRFQSLPSKSPKSQQNVQTKRREARSRK